MCMQPTQVRPYHQWHWAGDQIAYDTVIPASRMVPGTKKSRYPIDIREYLSTVGNAVVRKTVRQIIAGLDDQERALALSDAPRSFDLRADKVVEFVGKLHYKPVTRARRQRFDYWMFPDETLAAGGGDCEDLAFLLAALLEASGISSYCIRVALGAVSHHGQRGHTRRTDHAWVMYLNEGGAWEILEPYAITGKKHLNRQTRKKTLAELGDLEYTPYFVFNREHLWRVRGCEHRAGLDLNEYLETREFWLGFRPLFAAKVHEGIFDEALVGISASDLRSIKRASLLVDVNTLSYDPRDHFDFAYIDEGWERVADRLKTRDLDDFAYAIHATSDFYAHTFYADFAKRDSAGDLVLYDPAKPQFATTPKYDFSPYAPLPGCSEDPARAAEEWAGELISGQWWRWYTTFPDDLKKRKDFLEHRCLPDHDAVAVDSEVPKSAHRHYSPQAYKQQFQLRRDAAVRHVRAVYLSWKK